MKIAILYYTRTGNTKHMGEVIAEGMRRAGPVEVGLFPLGAIDEGFVNAAKCIVLGTPTYLASMAAAVKVFLDENRSVAFAGKIAGAYATEDYVHGGGDLAVQTVLSHLLVKGALVYSGGGAHGKPVIHLGPVGLKDMLPAAEETFRIYGERMAGKALELFGGKN